MSANIMMTAAEAATRLDAIHLNTDAVDTGFTGVSTDSRSIAKGELFVALKGENFDGHSYLEQAIAQGAAAALVSQETKTAAPIPQIMVADTLLALGRLAKIWRAQFAIPMLALTGSNGKTTVKEMLRTILLAHYGSADKVLATDGNLNNNIGLPLTMLRLNAAHQVAVFEMGMNHLLEIDYLTRLAEPDVALLIQAGTAHIGELGSRDAIAQAKGEIFTGLPAHGIAVINMHDRFGTYWRGLASVSDKRVISFGIAPADDVVGEFSAEALTIRHAGAIVTVHLQVVGEHNQRNALAAASGAIALNIPLNTIRDGLENFEGVAGRLRAYQGHQKATIIDDTYNANPDSVRAAIEVLRARPGKRLLVLGDMGELGSAALEMHRDIGTYAKHANLDGLYALGELTAATVMAAGAVIAASPTITAGGHFKTVDDLVKAIQPELGPDVTVLVKGSRFMKMERVVQKLVGDFQSHPGATH